MAGNSKDSKILAYKDMINQLNKTISTQTELIQSLQKTLEADRLEKENLHQQIEYLTKKLFGTSSEKRKDIDGQLNLFDEAEQEADPTWEQELSDDITVPEHKRKARRTHADLFKNVPSCDEIISLPEEERNCPTCGTQMECYHKIVGIYDQTCISFQLWCYHLFKPPYQYVMHIDAGDYRRTDRTLSTSFFGFFKFIVVHNPCLQHPSNKSDNIGVFDP